MVFYFSSTGNSLYVAKKLDDNRQSIVSNLNQSMTYEDEVIGFVFPCYRGSIPTIVEDFIKKNTFKAKYFYGVITYGNIAMAAELYLDRIGRQAGLRFNYINSLKMLDNSLTFYDMDKQLEILPKKKVDMHLLKLLYDVDKRLDRKPSGNLFTLWLSKLGNRSYRKAIGDWDKTFLVEDHCTMCGVCMKLCPVDNITLEDKVTFHGSCIGCYGCSHNCPSNAIRVKTEKSRTRYRHKDIKLNELMKKDDTL